MRSFIAVCFALALLSVTPARAGLFDDLLGGLSGKSSSAPVDLSLEKIISGLKEALEVGTGNAVNLLSNPGGYFKDEAVKILLPEKIRNMTDMLRQVGFNKPVDEFVLSMNSAAEKAADKAGPIFVDAIKQMTFEDAKKILDGGDTAATDYLKEKTSGKISDAFRPIIKSSMTEVGVTSAYQTLVDKFNAIPFMQAGSFDLEPYVTQKAMDGIFLKVGEEEKKIRANPQARVTDLLQEVFKK